ncbi:MAG TPA: hypothetical protein VHV76_15075, partial [Mycobacteriales bacterium]|nr:hypothetical protein [Mycobacteriales bacterium]
MQTTSRTRTWVGSRRRASGNNGRSDRHAEISPVWEVLPSGHQEVGARPAVLQRDSLLRRGLGLVDLTAAFAALLIVITVIDAGRVSLVPGAVLIVPFVLLAGKVIGLYDRDQHVLRKTTIDEAPSIFYLSVLYSLALWLGEAVLFHGLLQRAQVFGLLVIT